MPCPLVILWLSLRHQLSCSIVDTLSYEGAWLFWQHTDYGTVPGIDESVDLNVFNGSLDGLQRYTLK